MNVGILIITHDNIGADLLATAKNIVKDTTLNIKVIGIKPNCKLETEKESLRKAVAKIDNGDGVLILTDIFGATPCNLVRDISQKNSIKIVTGLNLAMLIRLMNYPMLSLDDMAHKAISAGHDSIIECQ